MTGEQPVVNPQADQHKKKKRRTKGPKPETKPFTDGLVAPVRLLPMSKFTFKPIQDVTEKKEEVSKKDEATKGDATIQGANDQKAAPPAAPAPAPTPAAAPPAQGAPTAAPSAAPVKDEEKKKVNDARLPKTRAYHKQLRAYNSSYGTRRYVQFVVCIGPDPRVLLFKGSEESIPGGYLAHDEEESEGIKRLWKELFHVKETETVEMDDEVKALHVVAQWHRPDIADQVYPYKSRYLANCKEQIKTYLVELKKPMQIRYPLVFKDMVVTDLYDVYDMKDPIVSSIPYLLSRFTFTSV